MISKTFRHLTAASFLAAALLGTNVMAEAQTMRLGTATEGGVWFVLGNGFAKVIGDELETTVTPVTTAGSMENARRLSAGNDLQIALSAATSLSAGIEEGTVDPSKLRVIGAGHGNFTQVVVREDSGIDTWTQAFEPGRTIGVGEPGSAAYEMATGAIKAQGTSLDDINQARLGHSAQSDAFKNRDIEVVVVSPGIPTAAVVDVMTTTDAKLLSGSDEEISNTLNLLPFMARGTIPADTYDNQTEAVNTVMMPSLMLVTSDITDDQAYKITKAIYESTEELTQVHSNGAQWTVDNALASREFLNSLGLEYHAGAKKYYEEQGAW
jgi:uncharacterized protein